MDKDALRAVFSEASRAGWSLRSDVQLQEWLEGFAERLKERTKEVAAEVHRLGTETGNVELHLQNNFNSLRALSATQFIENRVDEVDEIFVHNMEQPVKQSGVESYDSQIIPRYKEAVLTAWDAFEGFSTSKTSLQSSDVKFRRTSQAVQSRPPMKLPNIIGTDEFIRDSHCGLRDFKTLEVNARASSSDPVESGSDTDRDEARMAAEMVGGRTWLEGEWSATDSETSGHQGSVLEPAVSAALDFKAMLEAALRGPSFPYDGGIIPNLENAHGQHSYVDNTSTLVAQVTDSNTSRTRSEPGEVKLDGDLSAKNEQAPIEDNMQHQGQGLTSETPVEVNKKLVLLPPLIHLPPAISRNDYAYTPGSMGPQSPLASTPNYTPTAHDPFDGFPDPDPSQGLSLRSDPNPQVTTSTAKIQTTTGSSLPPSVRTEESKPQPASPASQFRPSAYTDDIPMPTLPDGLFQGLQSAIQARQLRSQSMQRNEVSTPKEASAPRPEVVGEVRVPISSKIPIASVKATLKDNRVAVSKSNWEPVSRLQKEPKGESPSPRTQLPIPFQGGLFDDDDSDDSTSDFLPKEVTGTSKNGAAKFDENASSVLREPKLTNSSSIVRKGLFDDFHDTSIGPPSESEAAGYSGPFEKTNAVSQPFLSLPDWKDAKRSRVVQKSLFGDSDDEDSL